MSQSKINPVVSLVIGFGLLIIGIALILLWWPFVVAIFRGAIGFILAMAGLLTLYSVKQLK